jgi:acetyl esterase
MPLDPQVRRMREARKRDRTPQLYTLGLTEARAADLESIQAAGGDLEPVSQVVDRVIPGPVGDLPVRIYRSRRGTREPALVYYFGGGWTLGSIDTSDGICRSLANAAGCTVITVGYRLAPEARFPAAVDDCYTSLRWISYQARDLRIDPARLAVGGDSAGGNLAAAVTLLARDHGDPHLVGQLLVYPNTDYGSDTASLERNVDPYLFNKTSVAWYWQHYLCGPEDGLHPLASPLRAESLRHLPPALVITAEYDPLRDQAEQYAERLRRSGVAVQLSRYDGMVHGFFAMAGVLDGGKRAISEAAQALRTWFDLPSKRSARAGQVSRSRQGRR